jgi:hypothetical protein
MVNSNFLIALFFIFFLTGCDSDEVDLRHAFKGKEFGVYITSPDEGQGFSIIETIEIKAVVYFLGFPEKYARCQLIKSSGCLVSTAIKMDF